MSKFLNYLLASILFCAVAMGMADPDLTQKNLEGEYLTIESQNWLIEMNRSFFEITKQNAAQILQHPTGYSPKKANTIYGLRSPIHREVLPQATLVKTKTFTRRNLLAEFEQNSEPKANEVQIEFVDYKAISSKETAFSSGKWALHDVWLPKESVGVNCDHQVWPKLIENMIDELSFDSQEDFIATAINAIHRHLPRIDPALLYNKADELVCRHFATIALPVFSKILEHDGAYIYGEIHQVIGDFLDPDWVSRQAGHVWNLLILKEEGEDDGEKEYWLVDAGNKFFINISAPYMKDLIIHEVAYRDGSTIRVSLPLKKDSAPWKYAELTREIFKLGITHGHLSLYQNENLRTRMAEKFLIRFTHPAQDITVVHMDPQ